DHVPQRPRVGEQHRDPIEAQGETAMRWRSRGEPVEQEPEPAANITFRNAEQREDQPLDDGIGDPDGATAKLDPVIHGIVVERATTFRMRFELAKVIRMRGSERMMRRYMLPGVGVVLEKWKVHHPRERMT